MALLRSTSAATSFGAQSTPTMHRCFLDSTAIRKLFALTSRLGERRQLVRVVTPGGSTVLRTLQLVEFARAAPMHGSLEEALAAL